MHRRHAVLIAALPALALAGAAQALDEPSDAEATAAYRPIARSQGDSGQEALTLRIKSCARPAGRPGVLCVTAVRPGPDAPEHEVTVYFARGPDSAWVAEAK